MNHSTKTLNSPAAKLNWITLERAVVFFPAGKVSQALKMHLTPDREPLLLTDKTILLKCIEYLVCFVLYGIDEVNNKHMFGEFPDLIMIFPSKILSYSYGQGGMPYLDILQ